MGTAAQHTPGRICDVCEGFCLQPVMPTDTGRATVSLHIGQRVRHRDHKGQRVTGVVRSLSVDSDGRLGADVVLDQPLVIPACEDHREIKIYLQHLPAFELSPFDDRDELVAELVDALRQAEAGLEFAGADQMAATGSFVPAPLLALRAVRAVIAKATTGAAA